MRTSEVLKGAAQAVRTRGLAKGTFCVGGASTGPVCAQGGILAAINAGCVDPMLAWDSDPRFMAAVDALGEVVGAISRGDERRCAPRCIACFNNALNRTSDEVTAAIERAAVIEEAKESQLARAAVETVGAHA